MLLGFSTGCLFKTRLKSFSDKIRYISDLGCKAIEVIAMDVNELAELSSINQKDLKAFKFVSMHAPARGVIYGGIQGNPNILKELQKLQERVNFNHIVFHPDIVEDWNILNKVSYTLAVENMDSTKSVGTSVAGLGEILKKYDLSLVLDLAHCFAHDETMKLADDIYNSFKEKVVEIHISGFNSFHVPLFETKQTEIIEAIPDKNLPIIIESVVADAGELKKELKYIKKLLVG